MLARVQKSSWLITILVNWRQMFQGSGSEHKPNIIFGSASNCSDRSPDGDVLIAMLGPGGVWRDEPSTSASSSTQSRFPIPTLRSEQEKTITLVPVSLLSVCKCLHQHCMLRETNRSFSTPLLHHETKMMNASADQSTASLLDPALKQAPRTRRLSTSI